LILDVKTRFKNVWTAFQLFSHTVVTTVRVSLKDDKKADLFDLINDFSDLCNSRLATHTFNPFKAAYELYKEKQCQLLETAFETLKTMQVGSRKTYAPFQRNLFIYIRSLQALFQDISTRFGVKYIKVKNTNQDMFSHIRGFRGVCKNPTVDFRHRMKKLVLTWNITSSVKNNNKGQLLL